MFKRRIGGGVLLAAAALISAGCSNDAQDQPLAESNNYVLDDEEAEVARYLDFNGIADYEFRRAEALVILEKDIEASFPELLDRSRAFDYSEAPIEKGSWYSPPSKGAWSGRVTYPIKLVFAANVPAAWKTAFTEASAQWDAAQCVTYSTTGSTTTVSMVDLGAADNDVPARAPYPYFVNGKPPVYRAGFRVTLNSTFGCASGSCQINSLSASLKKQIALHELGHTLGFTHPTEGSFLPGTPGGATVMATTASEPGIANLTPDDISSRDRVYKTIAGGCAVGFF